MSENLDTIKNKKIAINVGGKERHIYFNMNAFVALEDAYGNLEGMLAALNSGSIKAVRKFLFIGFMHEDKTLTEDEVGSWFDMSNVNEVSNAISDALSLALPKAPAVEEKQEDPNAESPAEKQQTAS